MGFPPITGNPNKIKHFFSKLYYYNNVWNISTKKCIDASKSKWLGNKNFLELFNEAVININIIENLNCNLCYSFILTHPENNMVVQYSEPKLYHISTRDMTTYEEININIGIDQIIKTYINSDDLPEIVNKILNDPTLLYEGYILIDETYKRQKIRTNIYNKVKNLWGNTNNRFLRYLELRKDINILNEYLTYFPLHKDSLYEYEMKISNLSHTILSYYMNRHVTKTIQTVPFYFGKIIYKMHGNYMKTKIITDHNKIMMYLLEMEPKKVCFIVNKYEKDLENHQNTNFVV